MMLRYDNSVRVPKQKVLKRGEVVYLRRSIIERDFLCESVTNFCVDLYCSLLEIIKRHPGIELAVPKGADLALHHHAYDSKNYLKFCQTRLGGVLIHDSECYRSQRFWNGWRVTKEKFASEYGISLPRRGEDTESLLAPGKCLIAINT